MKLSSRERMLAALACQLMDYPLWMHCGIGSLPDTETIEQSWAEARRAEAFALEPERLVSGGTGQVRTWPPGSSTEMDTCRFDMGAGI